MSNICYNNKRIDGPDVAWLYDIVELPFVLASEQLICQAYNSLKDFGWKSLERKNRWHIKL